MLLDEHQRATLSLWYAVNASLGSYNKLLKQFGTPATALDAGDSAWSWLGIHKAHIARLNDTASLRAFLYTVEDSLAKDLYGLIFSLPPLLQKIYDPPPLLFYRGNIERAFESAVAVVGTRQPSAYAEKITFDMAQYLVQAGLVVVSGLAVGVDKTAHLGALAQNHSTLQGKTVGVMGTGIDVCYPTQHRGLVFDVVQAGGCVLSELLPGTPAAKHTFPRRNRLVVGLAQATLVTEAAVQSGSMISARLTAEQGKQVFVVPGRIDTIHSEGCHHLIREGATLVYHPKHILEELTAGQSIVRQFSQQSSIYTTASNEHKNLSNALQDVPITTFASPVASFDDSAFFDDSTLPEHLKMIIASLDSQGQDLDHLVTVSGLAVPELLVRLMELELMGLVRQNGGRYVKTI